MKIFYSTVTFILMTVTMSNAQINLTWQVPPKEILELADAPLPPSILIDNAGKQLVMLSRSRYISLGDLLEKELRLAGIRIDPVTSSPSRGMLYNDVQVMKVGEKNPVRPAGLPGQPQIDNVTWSPDQKRMAFTQKTATGLELWVLDLELSKCSRLTGPVVNGVVGRPFVWFDNSASLLVKVIPADRKPLTDKTVVVPSGPRISESEGSLAQNPTYQDLLQDKADEYNFTQLARSGLMKVDVSGSVTKWKETDLYSNLDLSPDGRYFMVTTIGEPYSYMVPYNRFPLKTVVYDTDGNFITTLLERPLLEELPKGTMATEKGRRNLRWRNDQPATVVWVEALDGGDPAKPAEFRDEVFELPSPFTGKPRSILKTINRYAGIVWGNDRMAVATDRWWNTRNTKSYLFDPSDPGIKPKILVDRNYQDNYGNPGDFITARNSFGEYSLVINGKYLYLSGPGFSESGMRPFIDRFDYTSQKTERLWQADGKETLEQVTAIPDIVKGQIITSVQSKTKYPNLFLRNIAAKKSVPQQITFLENPYKSLENVYREVITYKRADGVELSGILYLPAGYDKNGKEKLPMLMWAYPQEFKDASTAGQITSSPNQFVSINYGSPLFWVTRGYAILDNAAFPIVGEGKTEPNDSFVEQLVANAKAAIDAVDNLGYIDRNRVAVGGHSYGAFMTANLLTHSSLFAAGIARSGAYNRTLTPFGFQNEERNYWEAPQVYNTMSPFMNAEKMKTPLLLVHGEADNNTGTFPLQSERYFNALKGLGGTVRFVLLPGESHGYAARENIFHMLWETDQWLDKWVKNKKP